MRRVYKQAPIEEAVVEFRFGPSTEWDPTIPGKLQMHSELKGEYPGKASVERIVRLERQDDPSQSAPPVAIPSFRIRLSDTTGKNVLLLAQDMLSVNVLRPYANWESFRPRIEAGLRAYASVVSPLVVRRIGVRYINRMAIPGQNIKLDEYFRCGPPRADAWPRSMHGFMYRAEFVYDDAVRLLVTHSSSGAPKDHSGFLLDLDVVWEGRESIVADDCMTVVDDLHQREGEAFEAAITDRMREVFDGS